MASPEEEPAATAPESDGTGGRWVLVGRFAALLLLGAAILLPWWAITATASSARVAFEFGLTGLCAQPANACTSYGALAAAEPAYRALGDVFGLTFGIAAIALVCALLAVILSLLRTSSPTMRSAVGILSLIAGLAALGGPLYLFATLPVALSSIPPPSYTTVVTGFFGGVTASGVSISYGGGTGWTLSLVASGLLLISGPGNSVLRRRRRKA